MNKAFIDALINEDAMPLLTFLTRWDSSSNWLSFRGEGQLTPDAFRCLKELSLQKTSPLVFHRNGKPLEYRYVQGAYNRAFRSAELPFSATHIMRRTGSSWILDLSGGDVGLAKQILGNADWGTVDLYAKRQSLALKEFNDKMWSENQWVS